MVNLLKLLFGFGVGILTAIVGNLSPMIVPALLAVMAAFIVIDTIADSSGSAA